jgi:hypothetical protein
MISGGAAEILPTPPFGHPCLVGFFIRREPPNKTAAPGRGFSEQRSRFKKRIEGNSIASEFQCRYA